MRVAILCLPILIAFGTAWAAEPSTNNAIWNGSDSVETYARREGLSPTRIFTLNANIKLELVLIPAGRFDMGLSKPALTVQGGQVLLALGLLLIIGLGALPVLRKRLSFSLRWLLVFTFACGTAVWGGIWWYQALAQIKEFETITEKSANEAQPDSFRSEFAHSVLISKAFYMGRFAITQEQYVALIGKNPSFLKGSNNPVETVSWDDAVAFCGKLNDSLREQDLEAKLPTEAQWEYACRAGTRTRFYSGNDVSDLDKVAWHSGNSGYKTHPVGQKRANAFGLCDMHGNVWQWCRDAYRDDYEKLSSTDPVNEVPSTKHVIRGGSCYNGPLHCRASVRMGASSEDVGGSIGFRIVLVPIKNSNKKWK